jgi:histidinol-phosphate aminotransferase
MSRILVTAGSTEVIEATLRTFVTAGDEVVIPAPSWPVYRRRLQALDASVTEVPLRASEDTWSYEGCDFLGAIGAGTRLVIVCSPNNPTGNSMAVEDLAQIAATGVPLLVDGAYWDFGPRVDAMSLIEEHPNVVVTRRALKK